MAERFAEVIRIDAAWFGVEPLDMRAGVDTVFGKKPQRCLSYCAGGPAIDEIFTLSNSLGATLSTIPLTMSAYQGVA